MIKYYVVPVGILSAKLIEDCIQTSLSSVRKSNDGLLAILKAREPNIPPILNGFTDYTHEEILTYLQDNAANWQVLPT